MKDLWPVFDENVIKCGQVWTLEDKYINEMELTSDEKKRYYKAKELTNKGKTSLNFTTNFFTFYIITHLKQK